MKDDPVYEYFRTVLAPASHMLRGMRCQLPLWAWLDGFVESSLAASEDLGEDFRGGW